MPERSDARVGSPMRCSNPLFARDWLERLHGRWFRLSREQFDAIHYAGRSVFKIGIVLFNLVPFVVLSLLH